MKKFKKLMVFGVLALIAAQAFSASADSRFNSKGQPVDHKGNTIGGVSSKNYLAFAERSFKHAQEALIQTSMHIPPEHLILIKKLAAQDEAGHAAIVAQMRSDLKALIAE